jgi:hypothetical protein
MTKAQMLNWLSNDEVICAKQIAIGMRLRQDFDLTDAAACLGDACDRDIRKKALAVLLLMERDGIFKRIKEFDNKRAPLRGGAVWVQQYPLLIEGVQ